MIVIEKDLADPPGLMLSFLEKSDRPLSLLAFDVTKSETCDLEFND